MRISIIPRLKRFETAALNWEKANCIEVFNWTSSLDRIGSSLQTWVGELYCLYDVLMSREEF